MKCQANRNLLFGMFALHYNQISQEKLISAFQAWISNKSLPLDTIIFDKGWMAKETITSINKLVDDRITEVGDEKLLLENMTDNQCFLHILTRTTNDEDILRASATVLAFFTQTQRHPNFARDKVDDYFKATSPLVFHGIDDQSGQSESALNEYSRKSEITNEPSQIAIDNKDTIEKNQSDLETKTLQNHTIEANSSNPEFSKTDSGKHRVIFQTEFVFDDPSDFSGDGTFGSVFRTQDIEFQRRVALKRLKAEHRNHHLIPTSFLLEAEITGKLDHPGVLPMYGLGKTSEGAPFYVMKFINSPNLGRLIADFHMAKSKPERDSSQRNQEFRRLLEHLKSVCMTVQYAHDRGVLHCDLKPMNIMTGEYGETYVVDWGSALLVNVVEDWEKSRDFNLKAHPMGDIHESRRSALHSSQGGDRHFIGGSPAYMGPEHRKASDDNDLKNMTPRCDVFSLGVILYEILSGKLPCRAISGEDSIKQQERSKNANYPSPCEIQPSVSKSLNAICMKAIAANTKDRYKSASLLADDLEKWLAGEPISAYKENLIERSRRWVRKNRPKVVAMALSLLFLTIGSSLFGFIQIRHNRALANERNQALDSEQKAILNEKEALRQKVIAENNAKFAETNSEIFKIYSKAVSQNEEYKKSPEREELRRTLLKASIDKFRKLIQALRTTNDKSPESMNSLAEGLLQLGYLTQENGDRSDAGISYEMALKIREDLLAQDPNNTILLNGIADTLVRIGELEFLKSNTKSSETAYNKAIDIRKSLIRKNPNLKEFRNLLKSDIYKIEEIKKASGEQDTDRQACQFEIEFFESLVKENSNEPAFQEGLADALHSLAWLEDNLKNELDAAREAYKKVITIRQHLFNSYPTDIEFLNRLELTLGSIGWMELRRKQTDAARDVFNKRIKLFETLIADNPTNTRYQISLINALNSMAEMESMNSSTNSLSIQYRAIELREAIVKANPTIMSHQVDLAKDLSKLGTIEALSGQTDLARNAISQAIVKLESLIKFNSSHPVFTDSLALVLVRLGDLEMDSKHPVESLAALNRAIEIRELLVEKNPGMIEFREKLADLFFNMGYKKIFAGQRDDGFESFNKAIGIREELVRTNPELIELKEKLASQLNSFSGFAIESGQGWVAHKSYIRAIELLEELIRNNPSLPNNRVNIANNYFSLGYLEGSFGNRSLAKIFFKKAIEISQALVVSHPDEIGIEQNSASFLNNYSWFLAVNPVLETSDYTDALDLAEKAMEYNPEDGVTLKTLGLAQYRAGKFNECEVTLSKLLEFNQGGPDQIEGPVVLAILSMAKWKMGHKADAENIYSKLSESLQNPQFANSRERIQFYREATNLLYPMTIPDDAFQY